MGIDDALVEERPFRAASGRQDRGPSGPVVFFAKPTTGAKAPAFLEALGAALKRRSSTFVPTTFLIASGKAIRERKRLWKVYSKARWRKLKGTALVQFLDGTIRHAEIHWYEAHGIGPTEYKIKRVLD